MLYRMIGMSLAAILLLGKFFVVGAAAQENPIPDFSGYWARAATSQGRTFQAPENGPGPIVLAEDAGAGLWAGDYTNPILQPHAQDAVRAHSELGRAGETQHPAWVMCWFMGAPLILNMNFPIQFLQTSDAVTIIYERNNQVRQILLNEQHQAEFEPTWYGSSVGHYEGNDTLVIDTRGQNDRAVIDRFGTPRSENLRVIERYTIRPDRSAIDVELTVEDQDVFTTSWTAHATYWETRSFLEYICPENNRDPQGGEFPMPIADKADF